MKDTRERWGSQYFSWLMNEPASGISSRVVNQSMTSYLSTTTTSLPQTSHFYNGLVKSQTIGGNKFISTPGCTQQQQSGQVTYPPTETGSEVSLLSLTCNVVRFVNRPSQQRNNVNKNKVFQHKFYNRIYVIVLSHIKQK